VDNSTVNYELGFVIEDLSGDGFVDGTDLEIVSDNAGKFISTITP